MKYIKKPVIIDAEVWKNHKHVTVIGADVREYDPYNEHNGICKHCEQPFSNHGYISTLEGGHIVCPNDMIIKGVKGEFYPYKPDIFLLTYEKVKS